MGKNIIIAIDGYSSCGKSTIAKALAKKLHFIYIDSGAMYRAVTLYFLRNNIDLNDDEQIAAALGQIHISFDSGDGQALVMLNGEDISGEIRQMQVAQNVSRVAAIKQVRAELVKQQQRLGSEKNIVMDGRDIGTTVFPAAQIKLFMTADPMVRAERRYKEVVAKEPHITLEEVYKSLAERDHQDTTRQESPLVKADDAIVLDNTFLTPDEQLDFAIAKVKPFLAAVEG